MGRVISVAVFGSLFAIRMGHHELGLGILPGVDELDPEAFVAASREVFLIAAGLAAAGMVVLAGMLTIGRQDAVQQVRKGRR